MITVRALTGPALESVLDDLAQLRIDVFRAWPYLYDGDLAYERGYMESYRDSPDAILVGAFDGAQLVGAATGTPMRDHADDFAAPLEAAGYDLNRVFYCAESVLRTAYRGHGVGHRFFDAREAHARALGAEFCAFCAVQRPADHPLAAPGYRALDGFWRKRGYAPLDGVFAQFSWRDIGETRETMKPLQVWIKHL